MDTDTVAVDLNVDAALVLADMVGIDAYPAVLALQPNIFVDEDANRVRTHVRGQLIDAGILDGDVVHPRVVEWLRCLERPDMELVVRVLDYSDDQAMPEMLRMSLVRHGEQHVLAVRCDDHVVIQAVFHEGRQLDTIAGALRSALGPAPELQFEPFSAVLEDLADLPADADECWSVLRGLGATKHAANVLIRVTGEVVRRAEVVMIEHRDGGSGSFRTPASVGILDTLSGRMMTTPNSTMDGHIWSTFRPGDDAALHASIAALVELLPSRSWFDTARAS